MLTPPRHESDSDDPLTDALGRFFDVVTESVVALAKGRSVPEVICVELAKALSASVVSFVRVDRGTGRTVTVTWTLEDEWSTLSTYVATSERPPGEAACPETLVLRLATHPREERLAVFSRTLPWSAPEARLVVRCREVMAAIDGCALSQCPEWSAGAAEPTRLAVRPPLTTREIEVLTWACAGSKARSIARRLDISERTVHKHLTNIYRKLGASDRVTAAGRAIALGLVDPAPQSGDVTEALAPSSAPDKVSLVPIPRQIATHHRGEKAPEH